MITSDKILLEKIMLQNQKAMEQLYDRYESLLFTTAMKLTSDKVEAEGLLKVVFHDVWHQTLYFLNTKENHLSSCLVRYTLKKHKEHQQIKIG